MRGKHLLVLSLVALVLFFPSVNCKKKEKKAKAAVSLSPAKLSKYIKCDGCKIMADNLYRHAMDLLKEKGGREKMGEEPILELLEQICDQGEAKGEWLNAYDVVGKKGKISLQKQDGFQSCGPECHALVSVCEQVKVRSEAGESDIAEKIYRGHHIASAEAFSEAICKKMTTSCKEPLPKLKDPRIDEPFNAIDSKKWEAMKMQKMMKGMGMKGTMYDRDSLKDMMEENGMDMPPPKEADDEEEDEEEDEQPKKEKKKAPKKQPNGVVEQVLDGVYTVLDTMSEWADTLTGYAIDSVKQVMGVSSSPDKHDMDMEDAEL
ncbi:hypothetical protein GUITHDRAFT_116234 [Guillardia theta CCMP2712]|uniref:Saposin B-type domain-containing protein n=1 Tax=Guillardia theta (strain CCMP2712) TaxID=905079 RepID=L1INB9_GUITC|nr:hypothetical protein GUITHDRAFT_116234 [Guillardia theta CCMP2712]EKX37592.1 hypothetical protein GUITHDRAFT_116234 [Guillardia theta CCMP2712]|eukprot:XP_005824572.1 hypothetical protein GUITHDRAFT_116234 [Guillardia theta CCMP2712]